MREFEKKKMSAFEKYLRSKVDIVSIISRYVPLTKRGSNYVGRCPFHPKNINKNLIVFPRIQAFKCRSVESCNGDVFDFIAKYKCINRDEAIQILATEIGIYANIFREVPVSEEAQF